MERWIIAAYLMCKKSDTDDLSTYFKQTGGARQPNGWWRNPNPTVPMHGKCTEVTNSPCHRLQRWLWNRYTLRCIEMKRGSMGTSQNGALFRFAEACGCACADDERLIDELVSIMHERQLSEEDVARRMGVALAELRAIEGGTADPSMGTVRRLAHAVGVTVSHHVEKDSDPAKLR